MNRRFSLKAERIEMIVRSLPALVFAAVVLYALMPSMGLAKDTARLDGRLEDAARDGNVRQVEALLEKGVNVNAKDELVVRPIITYARLLPVSGWHFLPI
jgi:hypothetical protein